MRIHKTNALLSRYVLLIACCAGCNPFAIDARAASLPPAADTQAVAGMNAGSAGDSASATSRAPASEPAAAMTTPVASDQPSAQTPQAAMVAAPDAGSAAQTQTPRDPSAADGGTAAPATTTPAGDAATEAPPASGHTARSSVTTATLEAGGLECSHEICKSLPEPDPMAVAMGYTITLCCTPQGWCGTSSMGKDCILTPDSEPQCEELILMGYIIASCCTPDGKCGINGKSLMMADCTSNEDLAAGQFASFITPPAPASCTPGVTAPVADPGPSTAGAGGAMATDPSAAGATAPPTAGAAAP